MFLFINCNILRQLLLDKQYYETEHVFYPSAVICSTNGHVHLFKIFAHSWMPRN